MIRASLTIDSYVLLRPVDIEVALPYGLVTPSAPCKVIWALHCAMGGGGFFFERLGLGAIADSKNVIIVAPNLGNGYYVNSPFEHQADFLRDELFSAIRSLLPVSLNREDNSILGISMGGFGAAAWALSQPESFGALAAISGVFDPQIPVDERARKSREQKPLVKLFTEKLMPKLLLDESGRVRPEADLGTMLDKTLADHIAPPRVALYCGQEDYLSLRQTETFDEKCRRHGLAVECDISSGGHNPAYWAKVVPEAVNWLLGEETK